MGRPPERREVDTRRAVTRLLALSLALCRIRASLSISAMALCLTRAYLEDIDRYGIGSPFCGVVDYRGMKDDSIRMRTVCDATRSRRVSPLLAHHGQTAGARRQDSGALDYEWSA